MIPLHNHLSAEHPDYNKTLTKIQKKYWWPGMKQWIKQYVEQCANCQRNEKNIKIQVADEDSPGSLEERIVLIQNDYHEILEDPTKYLNLQHTSDSKGFIWRNQEGKLVIPPNKGIRRDIMKIWHDIPTAGHPGRDETTRRVTEQYYWPGAKQWIAEYIKGCAICQQNKILTHRTKTLLYRIGTKTGA